MEQRPVFDLSQSQAEAQAGVMEWYAACLKERSGKIAEHDPPKNFEFEKSIYRLFGYAGTGKTTTIRSTISALNSARERPLRVAFAAFTGKAALVMRKQGLPAKTIHSLIYALVPPPEDKIQELEKKIKETSDLGHKKQLRAELRELAQPQFEINEDSELRRMDLLVLDECSMVNNDMLRDLLYFKVPILVLGDPGQLPPVEGPGALISERPDRLLTEIHRQAADNPIIDFATRARNGIPLRYGDFGKAKHIPRSSLTDKDLTAYEQILCGKNITRKTLNTQYRRICGYTSHLPLEGERLICLKNNRANNLFNGSMCEVVKVLDLLDFSIVLLIRAEGYAAIEVKALRAHFDAYVDKEALNNVRWYEKAQTDEFDFGYAITVHKSQGSQWDSILLYDDKMFVWNPRERKRWLYTGITRAVDSLLVVS